MFNCLGDFFANGQQLLTEIKRTRTTFDTMETQKEFGVCIVDYEQVQARVNAKYDAWQRVILPQFGVKLGNATKEMHESILKARNDPEHQSIEGLVGGTRRFWGLCDSRSFSLITLVFRHLFFFSYSYCRSIASTMPT